MALSYYTILLHTSQKGKVIITWEIFVHKFKVNKSQVCNMFLKVVFELNFVDRLYIMHACLVWGLVSSWFHYRGLLLNTKFEFTCLSGWDALWFVCRIRPSQLSCLGSSVGKSIAWKVAWSWVRVPPKAANFSLKNFRRVMLCCFAFLLCYCCCLDFLSISWSNCICRYNFYGFRILCILLTSSFAIASQLIYSWEFLCSGANPQKYQTLVPSHLISGPCKQMQTTRVHIKIHFIGTGKSTEWINQEPTMNLLTLIKYTDPDEGTTKKFNFLKVIQGDCMYFAVVLGIDEDTLMIFDKTGPREADDCKYILEEWMEQEGGDYEVTWTGLLEALNDAALVRVRRDLKTALTLHFSN